MGNYLDSGFDNNLIRSGYSGAEDNTYDELNSEELISDGSLSSAVTDSLVTGGILNENKKVITDIINENLDTEAAEILGEFIFSGSGAIAIATDGDNGIWLSPTGILAKKAGANTFALTTGGDATFGGNLTAVAGTLGALTLASGGNIKMGKTAYTDDANAGFFLGDVSGVAKFKMGSSSTKYFAYDGSDISIVGGVIQTALTGYRVKLSSAGLQFYSSDTLKGSIATDAVGSMVHYSADNFYFRDGSAELAQITGAGVQIPNGAGFIINAGARIRYSGGYLYFDGASGGAVGVKFEGSVLPNSDNTRDLGDASYRWRKGYFEDIQVDDIFIDDSITIKGTAVDETDDGSWGFITAVRTDEGRLEYKYRTFNLKCGIITSIGSESGWNDAGGV